MRTSTSIPPPSEDALTPSELVLIHGSKFADAKRPIGMAVAFVAVVLLGAIVAYWGMGTILDAWASKSWPLIDGAIVSSQIIESRGDSGLLYRADVQYVYEVAGQLYNGDKVWFGDEGESSAKAVAQRVVDRYPPGMAVQIAYDPTNSKIAVLEPGVHMSSFLIFFIGVLFMLTGLVVLIFKFPLIYPRLGRRTA